MAEGSQATPLRLPPRFEPSSGGPNDDAWFFAAGLGAGVWLTPAGPVFDLREGESQSLLRLRLEGMGRSVRFVPEGRLESYSHYYSGDPQTTRTYVPHYARVRVLTESGVEVLYQFDEGRLRYDLVVPPGVDVSGLRVRFEGADDLLLDGHGDAQVRVGEARVVHRAARAWQGEDRRRVEVAYGVDTKDALILRVGRYKGSEPLVIDPTIILSTYLGGSLEDVLWDVAFGPDGEVHVAGMTQSSDVPSASIDALEGTWRALAAKVSPTGSLRWVTVLGRGEARSLVVDDFGATYIAGNAPALPGREECQKIAAYWARLDVAGELELEGCLGRLAYVTSVDLGSDESIYIAGYTEGGGQDPLGDHDGHIPTTPGVFMEAKPGGYPGFVARFDRDGSLAWASYYGTVTDMNVTAEGEAWLTGARDSNFGVPITEDAMWGMPQEPHASGRLGFVALLSADGRELRYGSQLLPGTLPKSIALDGEGGVWLGGSTELVASGFASQWDGFIMHFVPGEPQPRLMLPFGGSGIDWPSAIALDPAGYVVTTGLTMSTDFPLMGALMGPPGGEDVPSAFVSRFTLSGEMDFSTLLTGAEKQRATGVSVGPLGVLAVVGDAWAYRGSYPIVPGPDGVPDAEAAGRSEGFLTLLAVDLRARFVWA